MTSTHEDEWEVAVGTSCKVTVCAAPECKRRILIPEQQQELTDCTSKANGRVDVYLKGWIWASYHASVSAGDFSLAMLVTESPT
jgi:hypothetical protein